MYKPAHTHTHTHTHIYIYIYSYIHTYYIIYGTLHTYTYTCTYTNRPYTYTQLYEIYSRAYLFKPSCSNNDIFDESRNGTTSY